MSLLNALRATTALAFTSPNASEEDVGYWKLVVNGITYIGFDWGTDEQQETE